MRVQRAAVLVAALVALASLTDARPNEKTDKKTTAPETNVVPNVVPTGYSITLDSGVKTSANISVSEKFLCGSIVVNITCRKATDKIVLNMNTKRLKINPATAKLTSTLSGDSAITGVTPDPSGKPTVELQLPKTLTPDHAYQLRLQFNGTTDALDQNPNGWRAALYIEAGKATSFFPCFDDPILKVPFDIKLARPKSMHILASVGSKNTTPVNNREEWVWEEMERTMPVSIRYFTVLISDLKLVNETTVSNKNLAALEGTQSKPQGVVVRVWGREMFKNALLWASSAAPSIVCSLQCIVGSQFPAARLDVVALPSHHGPPVIGQGLLVYRESGVQNVTAEGAALHIARGAASQFFGLLVTPESPKDERINTALVNYLATEAVRQAIDRDYLPNAVYSLYYELGSQFPLAGVNAAQRQNIEGNKAELVLRMLSITMGEKTMKAARLQLLEEKIFRTYTADQLWELVTTHSRAAGGLPEKLAVKDIIHSWMCRNKLPILEVTRNYEKLTAELIQSVFHRYPDLDASNSTNKSTTSSTPPSGGDCEEDSPWILPVVALGAGQPFQRADQPPRLWMTGASALLDNCSSNDEFLLVNPAETAPYVVNYDNRNWELLAAALNGSLKTANETMIDVLSRAKLVHDALLLGRAGRLRLSTTMTVVRTLEKEEYPSVWRPVGNVLDQLGRDMDGTRLGEKFNACVNKLLTKALAHVEEVAAKAKTTPPPPSNSSSTAPRLSETRALILNQLRRVGPDPCADRADQAFKVWKETDDPDLGTPLSDALLCCLFRWKSMDAWDFGLERLKKFSPDRLPTERDFLLKSLAGCPRTPDKKRKILNFVILENDATNFSESDQRLVLKAASSHGHEVLSFLIDNWDVLKAKYEKRPPMWETLVVRATSNLKTKDELQMLQKLAEDKKGQWGTSQSLVTSAIAKTRQSLKWGETAFPDLEPWLDKYLASNTTTPVAG